MDADALEEQYDLVVIGGGAAGLAGAVAAARMRRSVLVVDAGEPRNAPAAGVHNLLGREGIAPRELQAVGGAELERFGGRVVSGRVSTLAALGDDSAPRFAVALQDGRTTTARRLLLASGVVDELPPVPGLRELWGTGVLHCPFCHGWEVRDQPVAVLSTGPMTAHGATLWRQITDDVVVLTHTGPEVPAAQRAQLEARGVRFVDGEVVELASGGEHGVVVRLASGEVVERAAVVAASVVRADTRLAGQLGLAVADVEAMGVVVGTAVTADERGATSVRGVWAAGNAASPMAVVATAIAGGVAAGAALTMDLALEDQATAARDAAAVGAAR